MNQEFYQAVQQLECSPQVSQEIIRWLSEQRFASERSALETQLQAANQGNAAALAEIKDAFSQHLPIGTGGRRGKVGPGPNRFNTVVVRETAQGIADAIHANRLPPKVAIVYDTRRDSRTFAFCVAEQLAANHIVAVLVDAPRPTPLLSYLVRQLGCGAGVVISASHNPPQDNGIKIYGSDGAQILGEYADAVLAAILDVASRPNLTEVSNGQRRLIQVIADQEITQLVDEPYLAYVRAQGTVKHSLRNTGLKVVFTPLHGVGHTSVLPVLRGHGVSVFPVEQQCDPDEGRFSTVASANPESPASMQLAIAQAKQLDADLVLATDPDADRLGACARAGDEFWPIDGNRLGVLMLDHILQTAKLPKNGWVLTTLVTSPLIATLAKAHHLDVVDDLLVGFKHHAGMMREQPERELVFACEESHGYMRGNEVRDKDGAVAALLLTECAALARSRGQTLFDQLTRIWCTYGYHIEKTENLVASGLAGRQAIAEVMERWRTSPPSSFGGLDVVGVQDRFQPQTTGSPTRDLPGDVICFDLARNRQKCRFVLRPSGTEPKLKLYALARSTGPISVEELSGVQDTMDSLVTQVLADTQAAAQAIMAPFLR